MGYIGSDDLTDGSGTPLEDAGANPLGDPGIPTGLLATAVENVNKWIVQPSTRNIQDNLSYILGLPKGSPLSATLVDLLAIVPFLGDYLNQVTAEQTLDNILAVYQDVHTGPDRLAVLHSLLTALNPVTLPSPAPPTYGGGATANEVWDYLGLDWNAPASAWQIGAGRYSQWQQVYGGIPLDGSPGFTLVMDWIEALSDGPPKPFIRPDYTDIRSDDTLLSWLQRTDLAHTWVQPAPFLQPYFDGTTSGGTSYSVVCNISPGTFAVWAKVLGGGLTSGQPPCWPGLAGVTLGTSVPLGGSVVVPGPMQGLIVAVTTPPAGLSEKSIGGLPFYYRMGELSFATDNGDMEPFQYLGWEAAIYLPRTMSEASSAHMRVMGGASGTATPFTIP